MVTYQDLVKVGDSQNARMDFVRKTINQHKGTMLYQEAVIADEYDRHMNRTILQYQKVLYDVMGRAVPDVWTANYKLASRFFNRFITQENQYLLSNGVTWINESTEKKLGEDFDTRLQDAGRKALKGGVSFGYYDLDHLTVFAVTEFAPLYDEENGALRAGVRFWQIDDTKPLRATLYEEDGYTDYIWKRRDSDEAGGEILHDKRPYIEKIKVSKADGERIYDGENYPSFPIVPFWGNPHHQSELVGLREQIDCYDLIKSGYANTVDEASIIYWTLQNAGGMDDVDLAKFVEKMRNLHAAQTDDGVSATPNTMEAPYASREALLSTLRADLYEDAMALDTKNISNGATTATQIKAAYEPLNSKVDQYEYCVVEFINGILKIAGVDDKPSFTRSLIANTQEDIQTLLQCGSFLTEDYITRKLLEYLGDGDKADEIIQQKTADEIAKIEYEQQQMQAMAGMQAEPQEEQPIEE